ncbi:MAG TPA: 2,5-diamino-6-(ribosylamino)-4(3H)-pyrimidinone 5'-phosphate reductase [Thermoplasmatales archaeon]|nr:2,5-diamino-6-(ribosylamino)-4(3H)-pyrimidinone 5'-phosphate reductase [Thermoplasmatales archaeon]
MEKPYVIINCAMSADGKIALPSRRQLRISSDEDMRRVQLLRERCDAVLVGVGTVLTDDPRLTVKSPGAKQPLRVVLDTKGKTPDDAEVLNEKADTLLFVGKGVEKKVEKSNVDVVACELDKEGFVDLNMVLKELVRRGVKTLLVEGGGTVIWNFMKHGLFDECFVYIAPMVVGGRITPTMADGEGVGSEKEIIRLRIEDVKILGDGLLIKYVPIT